MNENLFAFLQLTLKFKVGCRQDFSKVMDNNESLIKAINEIKSESFSKHFSPSTFIVAINTRRKILLATFFLFGISQAWNSNEKIIFFTTSKSKFYWIVTTALVKNVTYSCLSLSSTLFGPKTLFVSQRIYIFMFKILMDQFSSFDKLCWFVGKKV